ncbi:GntR family transcriptional regulator [Fibrella sp. WM1]|uniref:GntR family transcriptional regulator n=1 Tax=Fibrella musci TaxID=3242485 RepID=UPI00352217CF
MSSANPLTCPVHLLRINAQADTPKYQQLYDSVIRNIEQRVVGPGCRLPSIFEVSSEFDISHGTVEKAYRLLQANGIINSVNGKGYYIKHTGIDQKLTVFLLFNKLSAHKKLIYDAFVASLGADATVQLHVYYNDFERFRDLLQQQDDRDLTHYVIIPHFFDQEDKARQLIDQLPKHKLLVLDKLMEGIRGRYAAVYQNFKADIDSALTEALPLLAKYRQLTILFPNQTYLPKAILNGFFAFCSQHGFGAQLISSIDTEPIEAQTAYITLMEDDLVPLVKKIRQTPYRLGQEVGILSYNDTPVKEIILDGITVMSTDFEQMGRTAAQLIRENRSDHIENPFRLIVRHSL